MLQVGTLLSKAGGLALASCIRAMSNTLDYQIAYYDISVDPARPQHRGPCIFVSWHETMLFPISRWNSCDVAMLASQHRDAQWLAEVGHFLGFKSVRGSTKRGGAKAIRELKKICQQTNLAITPDGPLGPRRELSMGPIYMSSRFNLPIVLIGFAFDRPWRMPTWDRFALPRPYSRARTIWGPRMHIPKKINRDGLEHYRQHAERMLNRLTTLAEQWAESGSRMEGQMPLFQESFAGDHSNHPHACTAPHFTQQPQSVMKAA